MTIETIGYLSSRSIFEQTGLSVRLEIKLCHPLHSVNSLVMLRKCLAICQVGPNFPYTTLVRGSLRLIPMVGQNYQTRTGDQEENI